MGRGWVGRKVLGQGGQGVAGWWSYEGPGNLPERDVVVKQGRGRVLWDGRPDGGVSGESYFLKALLPAASPHILKIMREGQVYRDYGTSPIDNMHANVGEVHRIYLEFAPGGDLTDWVANKF